MNRTLSWLVIATAAALAAAGPASAGSIVFTASTPVRYTGWTDTLTVPKFDGALGTLTSAAIDFTAWGWYTVKVENLSGGPDCITAYVGATVKLGGPAPAGVSLASLTSDAVGGFDGTVDFLGASGRTHANVADSADNALTLTAPADLAAFEGAGNILLPVKATDASWWRDDTGNIVVSLSTTASAGVQVTYTYAPVPEPATMLLVVSGAMGAMGRLRRRGLR